MLKEHYFKRFKSQNLFFCWVCRQRYDSHKKVDGQCNKNDLVLILFNFLPNPLHLKKKKKHPNYLD